MQNIVAELYFPDASNQKKTFVYFQSFGEKHVQIGFPTLDNVWLRLKNKFLKFKF